MTQPIIKESPLTKTQLVVAALLILASQTVNAASFSQKEVAFCADLKETADVVYAKKQEGVSKSTLYTITAKAEAPDEIKARFYTIIDAIFEGVSPDQMFDLCLEVTQEDQAKSNRKSSYVDI